MKRRVSFFGFATGRIGWLAVLLLSVLGGCVEQQTQAPVPKRYRLKTMTVLNSDSTTTRTTFEYDGQNRLAAYSQDNGMRGTITYDEQNRYQRLDDGTTRTYFTYQSYAEGRSVTAETYVIDRDGQELPTETKRYNFDADNRLSASVYWQGSASDSNPLTQSETSYAYTGDNITRIETKALRFKDIYVHQFDDKVNPFFGLIGPDIDEVRQFSRNNLTQRNNYSITYEYNAQRLPIRANDTVFTYEAY